MKRFSIVFLKFVLIAVALILVLVAVVLAPDVWRGMIERSWLYGLFGICYLPAILLFIAALYQAYKLLGYIDSQKAFSQLAVQVLKWIKRQTALVTVLMYIGLLPLAYMIADDGDAPGLIIMAFFMSSAPLVIAIFAYVLQNLLQEAIRLKHENDLTV